MSSPLSDKRIILGVCGSIAAYKSVYLLRELQKRNAHVRVMMTPSAANFVTPLTFSTISRQPIYMDMFGLPPVAGKSDMAHIDLGVWADAMLIAPITASTIGKLAHGIADNLLTSTVLALRAPLIIAPAMDADMFLHPATSGNIAVLKARGVHVIEPEEGELASGVIGKGRLAEVDKILADVERLFSGYHRDFLGRKILVTAGPTQEQIDPVRFISNRSSGKMGFAVAAAAANRGAEVRLVAGPTALETPRNVIREDIISAEEMYAAVNDNVDWCDALVMTAAVADYRPERPADRKLKKEEIKETGASVKLIENVDILKSISSQKGRKIFVGFALETDNDLDNASKKLIQKSLDIIVVNNPRDAGAAFGADTNKVTMMYDGGRQRVDYPLLPKYDVAMRILDMVGALIQKQS